MPHKANRPTSSKPGKIKVKKQKGPGTLSVFSAQSQTGIQPYLGDWGPWIAPLLIVAALFCFFQKQNSLGELFIFGLVIFFGAKIYHEQRPGWMTWALQLISPLRGAGLIGVIWIALCAVVLTFLNFTWLAPSWIAHIPFHQQPVGAAILLLVLLVLAVRFSPEIADNRDMSSFLARLFLFVIMAVGVYLRLFDISPPVGSYWDDTADNICFVRQVADMSNFEKAFIFPPIWPPIVPYTEILLWHLMPDATSLFVQRITCVIWDILTLWMLYHLGKEIAGRKLGVLTAAVGAVSKAMIGKVVADYPLGPHYFFVGLIMLITFRLMKKTNLRHFLQWGAAVGLGFYTSCYFPPMFPYFIFVTLGWLLIQNKWKGTERPNYFVGASALVLLTYGLYFNGGFSINSWVSRLVEVTGAGLPCFAITAILLLAIFYFPKRNRDGQFDQWAGWTLGSWLAAILAFPIIGNMGILQRIQGNAFNGTGGFFSWSFIAMAYQKFYTTISFLFWGGEDRSDLNLPADCFFGYTEVVLIFLGLAFCLGKWNKQKGFILLTAFVGIMPHVLTNGPHSIRLVNSVVPFLLIAGLGLSELLGHFQRLVSKGLFLVLICGLVGFWAWSAESVYSRVYIQWSEHLFYGHVSEYYSSLEDMRQGYKVFMGPPFCSWTPATIHEGHPVNIWRNSNVVYLGPDEKFQGVVIYMNVEATYIPFKYQIMQQFPGVKWEQIKKPFSEDTDFDVCKCVIPAALIPTDTAPPTAPSTAMLVCRRVSPPYWERQYASSATGFTFGLLDWEDKVPAATDPVPSDIRTDYEGERFKTTLHVDQGGKYEIACTADGRTDIRIDGRKVINMFFLKTGAYMAPARTDKRSLSLDAGDHQVVATLCYQRSRVPPDVTLRALDTNKPAQSLWTNFNF